MKRPKILAVILAGGVGGRLGILTKNRAKPVMPFGGAYRLIDFALSNCRHSEISDVWVIEQYQLHSLNEHLSNGRPWDLDKTYGGLQVLPPNQKREDSHKSNEEGFAKGNADAIYRHANFIRNFAPDVLLVLSADHIYKLDFRDAVEQHLKTGADVTMVTTTVPPGETASRFGVVQSDKNGRVTDFAYKPEKPESEIITTEVFVYNAARLLEILDELAANGELKDFGDELIPRLVRDNRAYEFRFDGYWRDVGTIQSYWQSNMDLLKDKPEIELDAPDWAILTFPAQRAPARFGKNAAIENSFVSAGCAIDGRVTGSILAPGVIVEKGAEVVDSIVLTDAKIEKNAKLKNAIVDLRVIVTARTKGAKDENSEIIVFGQKEDTSQTKSEQTRVAGKS